MSSGLVYLLNEGGKRIQFSVWVFFFFKSGVSHCRSVSFVHKICSKQILQMFSLRSASKWDESEGRHESQVTIFPAGPFYPVRNVSHR